jgi:YegS/Rv2252/BmrU family lipid kinase
VPDYPILDSDRYLVLLNPNAAGGQPEVLRRRIAGAMASHRVHFDIVETTGAEQGLGVIRAAVEARCKAVVAAGGDGTIALALRGTAGSEVPVALLPFGTGNQLALNFGVPVSLEDSVRVAVEGVEERIDLGRIGDEYFALIAGAGLDAEVMASATSELKSRLGVLAYFVGGLKHVITPSRTRYRIVADDEELEIEASMVLLANAGMIGAGGLPVELKVAPRTSFQDGLLDVAIFAPRHLPDMAAMLTRVALHKYSGDDRMIFLQAQRVSVEADPPVAAQIDGEARGETPIVAEIDPLAGRILVPR